MSDGTNNNLSSPLIINAQDKIRRTCFNPYCQIEETPDKKHSQCSRCKFAKYCKNGSCQKSHWKYGHKLLCVPTSTVGNINKFSEENIKSMYHQESGHFGCDNPPCKKLETKSEPFLQCSRCETPRYVLDIRFITNFTMVKIYLLLVYLFPRILSSCIHNIGIAPNCARDGCQPVCKVLKVDSVSDHAYELASKRLERFQERYEPLLRELSYYSLRTRFDSNSDDNLFKTHVCTVVLKDSPSKKNKKPTLYIYSICNEHYSILSPEGQSAFHKLHNHSNSESDLALFYYLKYEDAWAINSYFKTTTEWDTKNIFFLQHSKTDQLQALHNLIEITKQTINDMAEGKANNLKAATKMSKT